MISVQIDAKGTHYKQLNEEIREAVARGESEIELTGVNGQRYIGGGIRSNEVRIIVNGVPGNDLGTFMNGPTLVVNGNAQDGCGNTMNAGKIIVHGDAGDVLGYGMRGGKLFVRGDVGYRVGIHMKAYESQIPVLVAGGCAMDYLGEYMAGGVLVVLGLDRDDRPAVGSWAGTGMHGGKLYVRGEVEDHQLGREVRPFELTDQDAQELDDILAEYCADMGVDLCDVRSEPFVKLIPYTYRPYGRMYAY